MRLSSVVSAFLLGQQVLAAASQPATDVSNIQKRDTISTILQDLENLATCAGCEALLVVLQALAHTGNANFVTVITAICTDIGVEDPDVCAGAIGLEGPILAHDLRNMDVIGTRTAQLFCLTVFGACPWPSVEEYSVSFPVSKPATQRPASSGKTPLQIVHISDIHVDLSYTVGASYNCTKNICCRPYTTADDPGVTNYPAGEYGSVYCDAPLSLEESMYTAIESIVPDAAFTMFTGDVVEGAVWLVSDSEVTSDLESAYSKMAGLKLVYGVVGNHDASPVNSFPPPTIDTTISSQYVYDTLASEWSTWIGSSAAKASDSQEGSYSVLYPGGNLRIISVNTNFWYKQNFWLYENVMERDPAGLLAWLVTELQAAETAGERVFLLGHMPMGRPDAFHDASQYFDQIIQRYEATISACFFGHTHKDEFEISYSDYTDQTAANAVMNSYIAPALTPTSGNPTFRVYDVDPVTFGILDYTTYYTNISSPTYQSGPVWEKLYSVKEAYGPLVSPAVTAASAELTPAFWHSLTELFENDDAVFQQYYSRKSRDYSSATCTGSCKTNEICDLRAASSEYNCDTVSLGVNFKRDGNVHFHKRDVDDTHSENDLCHGSKLINIMAALASNLDVFQDKLTAVLGASFLDTAVNYTAKETLLATSDKRWTGVF